jgi:hypothetical protein
MIALGKSKRKLLLERETVRRLLTKELRTVQGGLSYSWLWGDCGSDYEDPSDSCPTCA